MKLEKRSFPLTVFALVCAFFLCMSASAHAQEGYGQHGQEGYGQHGEQHMMESPAMEMQVSDAKLEKVASAYSEIQEIRLDLQDSLAGVTDPNEAQEMQMQAAAAMEEAVQDNGLDVQTYNQVMEAAQMNPELRDELFTKLEQIQ